MEVIDNRNKIILILIYIFTLLFGALFGCAKVEEEEKTLGENQLYVYYLSSDKFSLERETYEFSKDNLSTMGMVDELLNAMKNPKDEEHKCAIPESVLRIDRKIEDHMLTVFFSDGYKNLPTEDEVLFRAAYVLTMTQIPEIEYVYFYVNEQPVIDALGKPVGIMQASDFVDDIGTGTFRTWIDLPIYYSSSDLTCLSPENITIGYGKKASVERAILEQLIAGPSLSGNVRTVPENLSVISVSSKEGTCYVNFNSAFLDNTLSVPANITIYSIVDSLCELSHVNRVKISVNGNSNIMFREVIDLSVPIERNLDMINKDLETSNYMMKQEGENNN